KTGLTYARSDRLRWAWVTFGAGYLIAFAGKLFIGDSAGWRTMTPGQATAWAISIFLLNVTSVAALVLFARVWNRTGIAPPWRPWATLGFTVLGLAIDGPTLLQSAREMVTLHPHAFGVFSSVAGDVIGIALVGPIFATAIALRGGVLMRPWLFLFGSSLCWIV